MDLTVYLPVIHRLCTHPPLYICNCVAPKQTSSNCFFCCLIWKVCRGLPVILVTFWSKALNQTLNVWYFCTWAKERAASSSSPNNDFNMKGGRPLIVPLWTPSPGPLHTFDPLPPPPSQQALTYTHFTQTKDSLFQPWHKRVRMSSCFQTSLSQYQSNHFCSSQRMSSSTAADAACSTTSASILFYLSLIFLSFKDVWLVPLSPVRRQQTSK